MSTYEKAFSTEIFGRFEDAFWIQLHHSFPGQKEKNGAILDIIFSLGPIIFLKQSEDRCV